MNKPIEFDLESYLKAREQKRQANLLANKEKRSKAFK